MIWVVESNWAVQFEIQWQIFHPNSVRFKNRRGNWIPIKGQCQITINFDQFLIKNVKICPILIKIRLKDWKNWSECWLKDHKCQNQLTIWLILTIFDWFQTFLIDFKHFRLNSTVSNWFWLYFYQNQTFRHNLDRF